jgi:hypothetical protein
MKTMYWASGVVLAGLLAFAGCGKSEKAGAPGVAAGMDILKFRQAFPTPTPEQQQSIAKVAQGIRYRLYPTALESLSQLTADPALTDAQKKVVNDMIEGIKQAMTNTPPAPAQ